METINTSNKILNKLQKLMLQRKRKRILAAAIADLNIEGVA